MAHRSRASQRGEFSNENSLIYGKPRWMWVEDACRGLIAATTAEGRWQIVREGFPKFQTLAIAAFRNLSPFTFSSAELRQVFDGIVKYAERPREKRLHRAFERMYDTRHRWDRDFAKRRDAFAASQDEDDTPTRSENVRVEKVVDGSVRRVH